MDLGFARAGVDVVVACEMEPTACATLRAAFPDTEIIESRVESVDWSLFPPVDIICGGPPCQPFSAAGRRRGEYDERDAFPHAIRVVEQLQPRAFCFENVRGLTYRKHADYLARVLADLEGCGYVVRAQLLEAADYGVPQRRARLFIVGTRPGVSFSWPGPTHGRGLVGLMLKPWVTVRDALGVGLVNRANLTHGEGRPESSWHISDRPAPAVTAFEYLLTDEPVGNGTKSQSQRLLALDAVAPTLMGHGQGRTGTHRPRIGSRLDDVSPTLMGGSSASHTNGRSVVGGANRALLDDLATAYDGTRYRRLETWEGARLQAFPDGWPFQGGATAIWRQIGNALPPPLAEAVARSIVAALS